jgi:hypothetical protein
MYEGRYVCMYKGRYVCMYEGRYVCTNEKRVCMFVCMKNVCMYVWRNVCRYVCMYVCMYEERMYVCMYVCMKERMQVYACTYVCMYEERIYTWIMVHPGRWTCRCPGVSMLDCMPYTKTRNLYVGFMSFTQPHVCLDVACTICMFCTNMYIYIYVLSDRFEACVWVRSGQLRYVLPQIKKQFDHIWRHQQLLNGLCICVCVHVYMNMHVFAYSYLCARFFFGI